MKADARARDAVMAGLVRRAIVWTNDQEIADVARAEGVEVPFRESRDVPHIYFFNNLVPEDFLRLLIGARCLAGNSSVGIIEGSYLGVPVVNVGSRQGGRERAGNVTEAGYDARAIEAGMRAQWQGGRCPSSTLYGDGRAGERIAALLASVELTIEKRITY